MKITFKRHACVTLSVMLFSLLGFAGLLNAQNSGVFNEDAPIITKTQKRQISRLNREMKARIEPVAKRDPRYAAYLKDFEELKGIKEEDEFIKRSEEFKQIYEKFNTDVLRKAGVNIKSYNLRLKQILPRIKLDNKGMFRQSSEVSQSGPYNETNDQSVRFMNASYEPIADTTAVFTAFPNTTTFKDCDQGKLTFADAKSVESFSETAIDENDCMDVKAARGIVLTVPSATTRKIQVMIELNKSELRTLVSCYGLFAYAYAYSSVGIRLKKRGTSLPAQFIRFRSVESGWSVLGKTRSTKTETSVIMSGTFLSQGEGQYDIQAYVRTAADTDGFALVFFSSSDVKGMTKITVTRKN